MSEPRIKAGIWVSMALRMGNADGRFGAVLRKGDPDAGGVLVVLRSREGFSVLSQVRSAGGRTGLDARPPAPARSTIPPPTPTSRGRSNSIPTSG